MTEVVTFTVTLMMWVTGCVFENCPVETYENEYFNNMTECEKHLEVWRGIDLSHHGRNLIPVGECVPRRIKTWEELLEEVES